MRCLIATVRLGERPRSELDAAWRWLDEDERALPDVCPIVGSFGAEDRWPGSRGVPDRLESALAAARVEHEIKVYPGAGHGFLNDHNPAALPLWVKALARLVNARYHEPSARDARRRILAFFRTHLADDERVEEPVPSGPE